MRSNPTPTAITFPALRRLLRWAVLAGALLAPAAWAAPFTDNNDGTVTDQATGLMWDQCPWGQSGSNCAPDPATPRTWAQALAVAQTANAAPGHKGYTDWRLPNKNELESLVDLTRPVPGQAGTVPSIDTAAFPGTPASPNASVFWSSTTYAPSPANAWYVNFYDGFTSPNNKSGTFSVRLVRSGQSFAFFDALDTTPPATTSGPTVAPGDNGTTAAALVTVSEDATGYWVVLPAASAAPAAGTLQLSPNTVALAAGVEATLNHTGLNPGTAYRLHFVAKDAAGNVGLVTTSPPFTTPNVPGAPANVQASPGDPGSGAIELAWDVPADNGSAITGYTVNPGGVNCSGTPCNLTGLPNAVQYSFTVQAVNGVGAGAAGSAAAVWLQDVQAINFPVQSAQTFSPGSTFAISPASATSGLTVVYDSATPSFCTVSGATGTMVGAGTCTLTANQSGDTAWAAAPQATQTVAIGLGVNAITFPAQAGQTYATGGTFAISPAATGKSSAPVVYSSLSAGVCTVSGTTVTMVSAGVCSIAADQGADANWAAAPQATQTVAIGLGVNAITFPAQANQAFVAGGTFAINPAATGKSSAPVIYSSQTTAVCTVSGATVTIGAAGTCTIAADQAADANWAAAPQVTQTVAIGLGVNAITFPAQANQAFVAGGTFAISPAATGKSSAPVVYSGLSAGVCTVAGNTVTIVTAGTCSIAADQAADANWAAAPQATQTVQIAATAPGAPTNVKATPTGPTQATVSWTPPANDGGGITLYTVRVLVHGVPSGQTCTATPPDTHCTVTGLVPGTTYTFAVEASNGAGGAASPVLSNPATPLADARVFSAPSPTSTGTVQVQLTSGGGAACAFEHVQLLSVSGANPVPPANVQFPHGLLDFVLAGCDATDVTLTITYPTALPQGVAYWKPQGGTWSPYGGATAAAGATTATLVLKDGGQGDDDGQANGRIVDPGGVGVMAAAGPGGSAAAIPTLSQWALVLLAGLMALLGLRRQRR